MPQHSRPLRRPHATRSVLVGGRPPRRTSAGRGAVGGLGVAVLVVALTACSSGSHASDAARTTAGSSSASSSSSSAAPSTSAAAAGSAATGGSAGSSAPTPAGSPSAGAAGSAGAAPPSGGAAPAGGGSGQLTTQAPVALDSPAAVGGGVSATVTRIESINGTAQIPGEISGPAVRLTLTVANGSSAPLDLSGVTVDLQDAAGASATLLTANGSTPFSGTVAPGASATGVYVYTVPTDDRAGAHVYVTFSASLPVVAFVGNLS